MGGNENLPVTGDQGWIAAGVPHRTWVEPVILLSALPADARVVTVADARTVSSAPWRRVAARLTGGVIPVGPGGRASDIGRHVAAAAQVISNSGIVAIFPETGPPARPPRLRRLSPGIGWFAAASGASVVPVVFGGTDELYLGRRIEVRILPPVAPPRGDADRAAIHAWMDDFSDRVQRAAAEAHARANANPPRHKPGRWLTGRYPRTD